MMVCLSAQRRLFPFATLVLHLFLGSARLASGLELGRYPASHHQVHLLPSGRVYEQRGEEMSVLVD